MLYLALEHAPSVRAEWSSNFLTSNKKMGCACMCAWCLCVCVGRWAGGGDGCLTSRKKVLSAFSIQKIL